MSGITVLAVVVVQTFEINVTKRREGIEVLKLYPDAELPRFEYITSEPGRLTIIYRSTRGFADLAAGLIDGCIEHFGENIDVQREDLSGGQGTWVRFSLTRQESP
jgi:hypothetical protein